MSVEIIAFIVAAVLFVITYSMFWAGLAGSARLLRIRRCPECGHLGVQAGPQGAATPGCPYCRHPWVTRHLLHDRIRHNFHREW